MRRRPRLVLVVGVALVGVVLLALTEASQVPQGSGRRALSWRGGGLKGYPLTVTTSGTGVVTGTGIDCGADCSESFTSGTGVTLTAAPTGGATFTGWSGACTGSAACVVTMSQAQGVTATFTTGPIAGCTVTAASANSVGQLDVQNAVDTAMTLPEGAVVCVPAGTATWAVRVLIPNTRSITLKGAGIGQTMITGSFAASNPFAGRIISMTTKSTGGALPAYPGHSRITGFEFTTGVSAATCGGLGMLSISGTSSNFRFDNNKVNLLAGSNCNGLLTNGPLGVVDHNTFTTTNCCSHPIWFYQTAWPPGTGGGGADGDDGNHSWIAPSSMGTAALVHYEDNTFTYAGTGAYFSDGLKGARIAFRFNTLTGGSLQNHGLESGFRSFRHVEYYFNNGTNANNILVIRSGTGLAFNNTTTGPLSTGILHVNTYRSFSNDPPTGGYNSYGFGACGIFAVTGLTCSASTLRATGTASGNGDRGVVNSGPPNFSYCNIRGTTQGHFNRENIQCQGEASLSFSYPVLSCPAGQETATGSPTVMSTFDGNTDSFGYPCADQAGRGKGTVLMSGLGPGFGGWTGTGPVNQESEPIYVWNNTCAGTTPCPALESPPFPSGLEDRDYYNHKTNFASSPTVGMGVGTRLQMDAITTAVRFTAFWVTNEGNWRAGFPNSSGRLYRRQGPGGPTDTSGLPLTWQPWYGNGNSTGEPYTYPHPLAAIP